MNLNENNEWGDNASPHSGFNQAEILNLVKSVVNLKFSGNKSNIKETKDRLNFACPYCGDSTSDASKLRGNLYLDTLQYHCFNCSKHTSLKRLLKDFLNIDTKFSYNSDVITKKQIFNILDNHLIEKYAITKRKLFKHFGWVEAEGSEIDYYLNFRLIKDKTPFAYDKKYNSLIIMNLNKDDCVIGLQIRPLSKNTKTPRFFTFNLTKLYEKIYGNSKYALTEEEKHEVKSIDSISNVFNILKIDFNKQITVFEGPFDSIMLDNSISTSGATKKMPINIENIRYWYDNDNTGLQKSLEHLRNKESVFLWSKYWNDLGKDLKVKDLNELMIYCKKNNIPLMYFDEYFSNNELDSVLL